MEMAIRLWRRGASYIVTPALLPAHSWREGIPHSDGGGAYARSPTSRGLGPQGTTSPSMAASWGRLVTSPSSCSIVLVLFHQRGMLWAVLWQAQRLASLYTQERHVLLLALCSAGMSSSVRAVMRASSAHGLSPLERAVLWREAEGSR